MSEPPQPTIDLLSAEIRGFLGYDLEETVDIIAPQAVRAVLRKLVEIGFTDDMDRKVQEERLEHDLNFNEEAAYRAALWVILDTPSNPKGE